MLLSIIIPIHNRKTKIRRCLDSIFLENVEDIQIICVDDASSDGTDEILKEYQRHHSNLLLIQNEKNMGAGYARNRGLEVARGKYIWFVDSDDLIVSGALNIIKQTVQSFDPDVACFDVVRRTETGDRVDLYKVPQEIIKKVVYGQKLYKEIVSKNSMRAGVWGQVYRRQLFKQHNIRFTEGYMAEDAEVSLKTLILAEKAIYVSKEVYIYEKNLQSVTNETSDFDAFKGMFIAYCDMIDFWQNKEWDNETSKSMIPYIYHYHELARKYWENIYTETAEAWIKEQSYNIQKQYWLFVESVYTKKYVRDLTDEKKKLLRKNAEVLVFGAGYVAKELVDILDKYGIIVKAYIVSGNSQGNPRAIYGVPVIEINNADFDRNMLVIIATTAKFYPEIVSELKKYKYNNILKILED